jgi:hypothetical protein
MNTPLKSLAVLFSLLAVAPSFAQTDNLAAARLRYKQEVANCAVTQPVANHRNCVKDARHALAEIKRGRMGESWQLSDFNKHAMLRCDVHKGDDKTDCVARMRGQGKTEGSVAGGGLLRELTTSQVATVPVPTVQAEAKKPEAINRPSGLMSNCRWVPPLDWVCK